MTLTVEQMERRFLKHNIVELHINKGLSDSPK